MISERWIAPKVMAGLVCEGHGKTSTADLPVTHQASIQAHPFLGAIQECL